MPRFPFTRTLQLMRSAVRGFAQGLTSGRTPTSLPSALAEPTPAIPAPFAERRIHLPSVIRWAASPAARLSARGVWYIRVPFTHRAPRARQASPLSLSWAQYRVARGLEPGQFLTAGPSQGAAVHAPGLTPYVPAHPLNVRPGYHHAARQEGLQRTGGARGAYLTFRTITSRSPGWWIPAPRQRPPAAPDDGPAMTGVPLPRLQGQRTQAAAMRTLADTMQGEVAALLRAEIQGGGR
jgi:hypothetical protein